MNAMHCESKTCYSTFVHNFHNSSPIFNIFHRLTQPYKLVNSCHNIFSSHSKCVSALPCETWMFNLSFSVVTDDVQVGVNGPDNSWSRCESQLHTSITCWPRSYCTWYLWRVRYLPSWRSTSTPSMRDSERRETFTWFCQVCMYDPNSPDLTDQNFERSAAASLLQEGSEWRQWTSDRCSGWLGTLRHQRLDDDWYNLHHACVCAKWGHFQYLVRFIQNTSTLMFRCQFCEHWKRNGIIVSNTSKIR